MDEVFSVVFNAQQPSRQPLYQQVLTLLTGRIAAGEWQIDDALPSEFELAAEMQVSQGTVRKALGQLVAQAVLYRRQGSGTFVQAPLDRSLAERAVEFSGEGLRPLQAELLSVTSMRAGDEAAWRLALRKGDPLWSVRRLLRAAGQVFVAEELLLPQARFAELDARRVRLLIGNLPLLYRRLAGVLLQPGSIDCRAVLAEREPARLLGVEIGSPVLLLQRVSRDAAGAPVEWSVSMARTDQAAYRFVG